MHIGLQKHILPFDHLSLSNDWKGQMYVVCLLRNRGKHFIT
jgi:hypothetical protein